MVLRLMSLSQPSGAGGEDGKDQGEHRTNYKHKANNQ